MTYDRRNRAGARYRDSRGTLHLLLPMTPFPLGFRQLHDERDNLFPLSMAMRAVAETPISKVWRAGPHVNQGQTNGCVGFSCFQFQQSEPVLTPEEFRLTPEAIYLEARRNDEWPGEADEGTSVRAGLDTLKRHGIIGSYFWGDDWQECVEFLLSTGPLVLGVNWYRQFFDPDSNGVISIGGPVDGGHAIFCHAADWTNKFITLRNSWGESWGQGGDCLLAFEDFDRLLKDGGVCAACTEPKPILA